MEDRRSRKSRKAKKRKKEKKKKGSKPNPRHKNPKKILMMKNGTRRNGKKIRTGIRRSTLVTNSKEKKCLKDSKGYLHT